MMVFYIDVEDTRSPSYYYNIDGGFSQIFGKFLMFERYRSLARLPMKIFTANRVKEGTGSLCFDAFRSVSDPPRLKISW